MQKAKKKMSLSEIYWAGYEAGLTGSYRECPYKDKIQAKYWDMGYRDGQSAYYDY